MQVVSDDFRCIFRLDLVQRIWKIPLSLDELITIYALGGVRYD